MAEVQIKKMSISHEMILNWLILNPDKTQNECAEHFGVTAAWVSVLVNSDCFKARWAEKKMFMDKQIPQLVEGQMADVVSRGLTRLAEIIEASPDPEFVLNTTDKVLGRMGFGGKGASVQQINQNITNYSVSREVLDAARGRIINAPVQQQIEERQSSIDINVPLLDAEKKE